MMKKTALIALAISTGLIASSQATVVGFGQLGGSNTTVPSDLASNAAADGNGYVINGSATPDISLTWDGNWDIHTSGWFSDIEDQTVGGGDWDNEGDIDRIGQLDAGNHWITFSAAAGTAVVIESFDFGQTAETAGITVWDLTLTDSGAGTVWSQQLTLDNASVASTVYTVMPNFTGELGESYTLSFDRVSETYGSNGRHALDNLTFSQAIPEPSSVVLLGAAGCSLVFARRRIRR